MSFVKQTIGFDDKWLIIIGIPIIAFVINIIMFPGLFSESPQLFFKSCYTHGLVYTSVFWFAFRYVTAYLIDKYPSSKDVRKRIFIQIATIIVGYFILKKFVNIILQFVLSQNVDEFKPAHDTEIIGSFMSIFLIWSIYEGISFYTKLQKSIREKEQLQRINIQSQLESLKNQVSPHFLFNSLNTLTYLIPEDSDKAVNFVQKLSKVYRYILEIRDKKIVTIGEELEFIHAYTFLLKERFGDNLNIDIQIPKENINNTIVPLSLQILFENCIKHNIISTQKPLSINVFIQKDKLIVKNKLQKKNHVTSSTRMGLENIKNRYQFFTEKEVDIIVTTETFLVALPMLEHTKLKNIDLEPV